MAPTIWCIWPAQNGPNERLRVGLCLSLVLVQPRHRATRWSPCRSWRWMCFHMCLEDTCQKMGDANKRLPVLMPTCMHHRACIVSNTVSAISLQRTGFSSLVFWQIKPGCFIYCQFQSSASLKDGQSNYWKSSEELPFQVSRKEEQSAL